MSTRIALIGAGGVAQRHAQVLSGLPGVDVVAVADPLPEAARVLADACGARACAETDEALDVGVGVDAAYVCVPPFAHGPAETAVLERGLPLFVEKPVALDLDTAERLAELVEQAGVVTATGYHWRHLDVVERAQQLLTEAPALLASGYWLDKRPPVAWWGRRERSGGQVVEQLTHVLDLARLLLGEAVEVYAAPVRDGAADGDVDDATAATVRFAGGAVATFVATSVLTSKHRAALHTVSRGLRLEISETALVVDDGSSPVEHAAATDPKVAVDADFIAAVRGERAATRTPYAEAVRSHRLACAVSDSALTGRPVQVGAGSLA